MLKELLRFIGRLWAYLPVILADNDYDYSSILKLMQFKIRRLNKHIEKHGHSLNSEKHCRRMWIADQLLTRILAGDYGLLEHERLCDKWGDMVFVKGIHGTELKHAKETPENREELNADVRRVMQSALDQEEADWKAFWEYLSKYMRTWWD